MGTGAIPKGKICPGFIRRLTEFGKSLSALNNGWLYSVAQSIFSFQILFRLTSKVPNISHTPRGLYHPPSVISYSHDTNGGCPWSYGTAMVSRSLVSGDWGENVSTSHAPSFSFRV